MISVIIPVYNEEMNIINLYERLTASLQKLNRDYEIIYVDDGSKDKTLENLIDIHKKDGRIRVIKLRKNFGQSAAMKAGFDNFRGDFAITIDGDLQNDPVDIPKMLRKIEEEDYDVVCGWRFERKDPLHKMVLSKIANIFRTVLTGGDGVHDSGCTLRIYKKECLKDLELYGEMHRYIPALLTWKGYKVGEMKVTHHKRMHGKTKYNWRRLAKGFLDLMVVAFWQKYSFRPIHMFGVMGLILGFLGFMVGTYLGIQRLFFGMNLSDRPLFMVSIFMIIVGVQFFITGILADIMIKIYYGQGSRKNYLIEKMI